MDLVVDQVYELHHVYVTNGNFIFEGRPGPAIIELCLSRGGQAGLLKGLDYVFLGCAVEDRRCHIVRALAVEALSCRPTEMSLEYLSDIHSRGNPQWVQYHINRGAVLHER